MLPTGKNEILFTLQDHNAEKAGPHHDLRLVLGSSAFSFATKKELPAPGESITLFEQPLHSSDYALSKKVIIPHGQYGAGITTLRYVKKATMEEREGYHVITLKSGEKYLLKKVPSYGQDAYLFKNLGTKMDNKYLEKISSSNLVPRLRKLSDPLHEKYLKP